MIEHLLERAPVSFDQDEIRKNIDGKSILITGAAGSIGSEIVRQLLNFFPRQLILVDQSETGLFLLQQEIKNSENTKTHVTICIADITDTIRMNHVFQRFLPDTVYHAAAYKHVPLMEECPYSSLKINFFGTKLLADLAIKTGVKDFLFLSTDKAVNPISVMGKTKRLAEMYLQSRQSENPAATRFIITRFGNVLGSSGSVIPHFTKQILANEPVTLTHPQVSRYFITLQEAGQLVLQATSLARNGELLTLTMGAPIPIRELAIRLHRMLKPNEKSPVQFSYIGLRPGEKLHEELIEASDLELPSTYAHIKRFTRNTTNSIDFNKIVHQIEVSMLTGDDRKMQATLQLALETNKEESVTN